MGIFLEEFICGTTFEEFESYLKERVISRDLYGPSPSRAELRALFVMYDRDGDGVLSAAETRAVNDCLISAINALRCALIVVDFQNDFVSGSLSIRHGPAQQDPMEALPPLNALLERQARFRRVIYTMDWHPPNHISFYEHCRNSDRTLSAEDRIRKLKPFDVVQFEHPNFKQVLYPSHCVQSSWGAELSAELIRADNAKYVMKGSQVFVDAYSGFVDNRGEYRSELESLLKQEKIKALFICGLALDICVAATAKDATKLGFLTAVVLDCSKGLADEQIHSTRAELCDLNVAFLNSRDVEAFLDHRRLPWRWVRRLVGGNMRPKSKKHSDVGSAGSGMHNLAAPQPSMTVTTNGRHGNNDNDEDVKEEKNDDIANDGEDSHDIKAKSRNSEMTMIVKENDDDGEAADRQHGDQISRQIFFPYAVNANE